MAWPRRRRGGGGERVVKFFFWYLKLDVAFVAELESRFQRESVRVPWRNLFGKRGGQRKDLTFTFSGLCWGQTPREGTFIIRIRVLFNYGVRLLYIILVRSSSRVLLINKSIRYILYSVLFISCLIITSTGLKSQGQLEVRMVWYRLL